MNRRRVIMSGGRMNPFDECSYKDDCPISDCACKQDDVSLCDVWNMSKDYYMTIIVHLKYGDYVCADYVPYSIMSKSSHINEIFSGMEDDMASNAFFDFMYVPSYDEQVDILADLAMPEPWAFPGREPNCILKHYLSHTFSRLMQECKVVTNDKYCVFNTGLFTKNYDAIYGLADKSSDASVNDRDWVFRKFCTECELDETDFAVLPERANYFEDPSLLIFNWRYDIRLQFDHILYDENNLARLPQSVRDSELKLETFQGVVAIAIKRVIANYKLAVPQYCNGKIQLLVPLYFEDKEKPALALVMTRKNGYYQGHTCLTIEMAYNNARLIARPESRWLLPPSN